VKIDVGAAWCHIREATLQETLWLKDYLVYEVEGARFTPQYKAGWWDGKVKLYYKGDLFPVGLLKTVKKAAAQENFTLEFNDKRIVPCLPDETVDLSWMRPYQRTAIKHAEDYVDGILWIATGGGKTECFIGMAMRLPCRWLFIAPQKDLVHQAAERFEKRTGERPGIIGDGIWNPNERVTFATFQTLDQALDKKSPRKAEVDAFLAQQGGLCVDEAHTLGADSFWKVAMACKNAYYRIGLSATPLARGDKRSIYAVAALGPVIYRVRPTTLIDAGILAAPIIHMVPLRQDHPGNRYGDVYEALVVNSQLRNKLVCDMTMCATRPGLVFVDHVDHGRTITKALQRMGLNAEFVHGKHGTIQRKGLIERLNRADLDFAVATKVFKVGVDIPDLRSIINGAGGKSKIGAVQMLGRGSRKPDGKDSFEFWDVYDRGNKWTSRHAHERYKAYEAEGYKVNLWKEGIWPNSATFQRVA
jgi:superfamily II DNA or RNA helicase